MKNIRTIISAICGGAIGFWVCQLMAGQSNNITLLELAACMITSFVVGAFVRLCIYWFETIIELNNKIDWEEGI